ncbi:amino acid permease [Streptomyces lasalocidi]
MSLSKAAAATRTAVSPSVRGPRRSVLFFAFAFAVIADPVSSVAYAIEAALRALHGDLALLLPTMSLVIGLVVIVTANYWQLVRRFPKGGGAAAAAGRAFGARWTFLPIGALVVDFVLTIGISIAAATSAVIALVPSLAPVRIPLALLLLLVVAGLTWFGHGGRLLFAIMTVAFVIISVGVLILGFASPHATGHAAATTDPGHSAVLAVVLAFPVAMALATGIEAPSTAIAQLGQLDDTHRRRFGRGTLALLLVIVGGLTLALTALAVRLHIGIPGTDSTQIADIAHAAAGPGWLYDAFQLTSSLLLLAAASSSFQAGPGLLKALAGTAARPGVLPPVLGRINRHHTPYWSVVVYLAAAALIIVAAARPGTGTRPVLRRRRLRQLPGRPRRHGPLRPPGTEDRIGLAQRPGRRSRRLHPRGEPAARLAHAVPRRHRAHRGRPLRTVGTGGTPGRHRGRRGTRRSGVIPGGSDRLCRGPRAPDGQHAAHSAG